MISTDLRSTCLVQRTLKVEFYREDTLVFYALIFIIIWIKKIQFAMIIPTMGSSVGDKHTCLKINPIVLCDRNDQTI